MRSVSAGAERREALAEHHADGYRARRGAWAVYGRQWAPWVALALGGVMFVAGAVALLSR